MKNLLFTFCFFGFSTAASAQFEVKTNPIALLFEVGLISLEVSNLDDWGGQLDIVGANGGGWVYGTAKYYLNPKYGADRFQIGAFAGSIFGEGDSAFGLGFELGYKVLSRKRLIFEASLGIGRAFGSSTDFDVLPYGNLNVGYRFLTTANKNKVPSN